MQKIEVSDQIILNSLKKSREMGRLKNSLTAGEGNLAGFIGEFVVNSIVGGEIVNTYGHDIVLPNGITIDVKTTRTSVEPKGDYSCLVSGLNTRQDADMYVFTRVVTASYQYCWVLGYMPKKEFLERASFHKRGTSRDNSNFVYKSDTHSMNISDLKPIEQLILP